MIFVSIVIGKVFAASACNNPSDSITEIVRLEQFDYYNQNQNEVLYFNMENVDLLPPTAPSLVFARETYTPYNFTSLLYIGLGLPKGQ